ncbi:MAG: RDD family protein [Tenericutes bacterium]|nr:RDD family protein [Mycoplasmatota bacterium]
MSASFFKRLFSSVIDIVLVFLVVYLAFIAGGRTLLRDRVENFEEIYSSYNEVLLVYNGDLQDLQTEYDVSMEIADGDQELEDVATVEYNRKVQLVNDQNAIDIEPFNEPLTQYFLETIYFYAIGFLVIMTILSLATLGRTPGRRLMSVKLVSQKGQGEFEKPNPILVFFHDVVLKYFFIIITFIISMYYGLILILVAFTVDLILIMFTRDNTTLRDMFLKIRVLKASNGRK